VLRAYLAFHSYSVPLALHHDQRDRFEARLILSTPRRDLNWRTGCSLTMACARRLREVLLVSATLAALMLAAILAAAAAGGRVVVTDSIPRGLYWQSNRNIDRGSIAGGCLPLAIVQTLIAKRYALSGDCPGRVLPYVKFVAAIPGDVVSESSSGISVNGELWPRSRPLRQDSRGESLSWKSGTYVIRRGQVLLLGSNPRSYDGRYFGPVPLAGMTSMRPVFVERSSFE